jgi:muconolactone delta-isomerase
LGRLVRGPALRRFLRNAFGVLLSKIGKEETTVLVFADIRVNPKDMSLDELWDIWEEEAKATLEAMEAGKVVSAYKVCGQRRVVMLLDMDSYAEMDRVLMAGLPLAHHLEIKEIVPVREYEAFASDVMQRWQQAT